MKIDADIVGGSILLAIGIAGFIKFRMWQDVPLRRDRSKPCDWCGAEEGERCPILCGRDPDCE
jgi:hypothetical protein